MSDTPQLLLAHHLKAFKLPTFLREYDKQARQCAAEGVDHVRYLVRLTELELIDRERRMVERRITHAAIYNTFNVQRHLITRKTMRQFRGDAMNTWRTVTAAA